MKRMLMMAVMFCLTAMAANAQDVFKILLEESKKVANDKSKDIETRKIATFKFDALSYMAMQVRDDVLRDSTNLEFFNQTMKMLNEQSMALQDFVTEFLKRYGSAKKKEDRELVMAVFRNASMGNPMYEDKDSDLVLAYYKNETNYITRFSLDTDWVKALAAARAWKWK
ncbi:MAG: hypothetical protein II509_00250 [Prevotella sp.]|nr:hypothetical protein [Prevotella sp.]